MKKKKEKQPIERGTVDIATGLSEAQVSERIAKGYTNDVKIGTSKSYFTIFSTNIFTFFNFICFAVFLWIITIAKDIDDWKNCTFFVVILVNTAIGIAQEIKAKKTIDQLSLLSTPEVIVLRGGEEVSIKINEILLDDVLVLSSGKQICSDAVLGEGSIEVNESLLTGESLPIKKEVGDTLLSGSFVISGHAKAKVISVAEDNYIQKLAIEAKQFKKPKSELVRSLKLIMRIIGFIIVPVAILAFLNTFNSELNNLNVTSSAFFGALGNLSQYSSAEIYKAYRSAVTPTATSIIGMIPVGMFLLTTVALAVGILRLAKRKALVQDLYSIETLARVDTLCLDKTGTITDGTMSVKETVLLGRKHTEEKVQEIIASMQAALDENNQTAVALQNFYGSEAHLKADQVVHFSSERKTSAVRFGNDLYILGAPEYVSESVSEAQQKLLDQYAQSGFRCLMLAQTTGRRLKGDKLPKNANPVALIVIEDNVKEDAFGTIRYFKENGVDVRVISGDNAAAVSFIAAKVGIERAEEYISLKDKSDEEVIEAASKYTVFGRVNPNQKKLLIKTLKEQGRTVAMTGDGINDILALKEADCSIAMANGSEATRNVAQLVLLDSNFSSMPNIVAEGRRVVNNIQRSSTLFLTKTVFSFMMTILLVFLQKSFPLEPIQLSFISLLAIGFPSFVLAMEPNNQKIQGRFIGNVFKGVIPPSIAIVFSIMLIMVFDEFNLLAISPEQIKTMVMITIFAIYILMIVRICKPFNTIRTLMLTAVLVTAVLLISISPILSNQTLNIFKVVQMYDVTAILTIIALISISYIMMGVGHLIIRNFIDGKKTLIK